MNEHIPVLIKKKNTIDKLDSWNTEEVEKCYDCGSEIFYIAVTKGLLFSPYKDFKVIGETQDWANYEIEKSYTTHVCAICGQNQGGTATWKDTIFEIERDRDTEDYHEALHYLKFGTMSAGVVHDSILRLAEEIKDKVNTYWTRHNIVDAINKERAEAKKKGLNQVKDEKHDDQNKSGNTEQATRS